MIGAAAKITENSNRPNTACSKPANAALPAYPRASHPWSRKICSGCTGSPRFSLMSDAISNVPVAK